MRRLLLIITLLVVSVFVADAQSREVEVECEWGSLSATIDMPEGETSTAVLVVAGSGPTDRYGNSAGGLNTYSYKMLGEGLAKEGFAVMRYDKRAIGLSAYPAERIPALLLDDYIDDARRCVEFLRTEGFDRVIVAGHSEGGLIALVLASDEDTKVDGVVLLCAAGYPMDEILNYQLSQQLVPAYMGLMMRSTNIIRSLKQGEQVPAEEIPSELMSLFHPSVQPFIINSMQYDPVAYAKQVKCPVLIVSGGRDIQVASSNGVRLAEAMPEAELVVFENMTHVLKDADTSDRIEQLLGVYSNANLTITEGLVLAIVNFINNK